ncbi:MAG: helix-turn-helix domain-containing protein [Steroidobacteraceae bacterium]
MIETEAEPGLIQIGETLRAAREVRRLSLDQAAARLRCDLRVIECLEEGRFADIGPPVFARGHLLRYAEMLGESGEAMVVAWAQAAAGTSAAGELMSDTHPRRTRDLRRVRRQLVIGTAILCAAIIAIWSLQQLGSGPTETAGRVAVQPAAPAAPVAAAPVAPATDAAEASRTTIATSVAPVASTELSPPLPPPPRMAAAPASTPSTAAEPAAATTTGAAASPPSASSQFASAQLAVTATADSWLEIYDRRNRRLFFGVAKPGTLVDVRGNLPLRVVVGNVPATTFELDGRRIEVPREAMRGPRAATFRVDADGRLSVPPRA